jgi:peroxidase
MPSFYLTLVGFLTVVAATHNLPDVSAHLERAMEEIRLVEEMRRKSSKRRSNRVTQSSRAMSVRNRVLKRTVAKLKKEGLHHAHASSLALRALHKHQMRPVGFANKERYRNKLQPSPELPDETVSNGNMFFDTFSCKRTPVCDASAPYRTITGECNNIAFPLWGAVNIPFPRFLKNAYDDGISIPRGGLTTLDDIEQMDKGKGKGKGSKGPSLPFPRFISSQFFPDVNRPSTFNSLWLMQVGQFLDHDIALTPEEETEECCHDPEGHECFPVVIPLNDSFFSQFKQNCFQFTRSVPFCEVEGTIRQQFNTDTSFIDNSNVYGSTKRIADLVRTGNVRGRLAHHPDYPAVPGILPNLGPDGILLGGDVRVEEQPGLTTIHNLFFREHNRLARLISAELPTMGDEGIFQLARRLVIAQWQNILYTEMFPVILGERSIDRFNIRLPENRSVHTVYEPNVNPSIVHSFASAAYRFGHSLLQGAFNMASPTTGQILGNFELCEHFDNNALFLSDDAEGGQEILAGMIKQPAQIFDRSITSNVTNHLFAGGLGDFGILGSFGQDLMSRNIQRARDHGIPAYNEFRKFAEMSKIKSFARKDRPDDISPSNFALLSTIYPDPSQIDLWVGGLAETPVFEGVVGPTFNFILSTQFRRLKFGDRFFFTHGGQSGSFTPAQLRQLRGRTMRDIICSNSNIKEVREDVLLFSGIPLPCRKDGQLNVNRLSISLFNPSPSI